jgi:hypothetical protein
MNIAEPFIHGCRIDPMASCPTMHPSVQAKAFCPDGMQGFWSAGEGIWLKFVAGAFFAALMTSVATWTIPENTGMTSNLSRVT